jgi:hypothetical protein
MDLFKATKTFFTVAILVAIPVSVSLVLYFNGWKDALILAALIVALLYAIRVWWLYKTVWRYRNRKPFTGDVTLRVWTRKEQSDSTPEMVDVGEAVSYRMWPLIERRDYPVIGGRLVLGLRVQAVLERLEPDDVVLIRARRGGMVPWEYFGTLDELETFDLSGLWVDEQYVPRAQREE